MIQRMMHVTTLSEKNGMLSQTALPPMRDFLSSRDLSMDTNNAAKSEQEAPRDSSRGQDRKAFPESAAAGCSTSRPPHVREQQEKGSPTDCQQKQKPENPIDPESLPARNRPVPTTPASPSVAPITSFLSKTCAHAPPQWKLRLRMTNYEF